ncbi:hypothetical protein H2O64_06500 [Kordia sp. YSTF-M3]|uniref:HEXXH motif domain-containing protein n=1 Tax=Kordia aestuariivivens TaxID=2759037 RepID=A0ABR7Q6X4_9FLAO|nr:hypothetical protein [Kordia aestuariivivens]MBC8754314.1 hypothetical protein [Kordia aestuariivivens]
MAELLEKDSIISDINEKINTVKILLYKEAPHILEKIDFDDDEIFCNPLLFAYFRHKVINTFKPEDEKVLLEEFMQGYYVEKPALKLDLLYNEEGIAYVPSVGYFKKGEDTPFAPTVKVKDSSIKILRCSTPFLKVILDIPAEDQLWDDKLYNDRIDQLNNAMDLIRKNVPDQYKLIDQCCEYIYMFNTDPTNSNSFASGNALGLAFFNVYQEEYNEIFFIDDIAHQTGHVIMNNLMFSKPTFYKIDQTQSVEEILGRPDHRNVNILIHALYTYYTTFYCLDECVAANSFEGKQYKEALARIGFYQRKCNIDLQILDVVIKHYGGLENMLTKKGLDVVNSIKNKFEEINKKWGDIINAYDFSNQSYNFSFKLFEELNP